MNKYLIWVFSFAISVLLHVSPSNAQTMKELYEFYCRIYKGLSPTERSMAQYFVNRGENALSSLQHKENLTPQEARRMRALQHALAPILNLRRLMSDAGATQQSLAELSRLQVDINIARETFDALGAEQFKAIIQGELFRSLRDRTKERLLNSHGPTCLLLDDVLAKLLELNDNQRERIQKCFDETCDRLRNGPGKEFSQLENLIQQHWAQIRRQLTADQRKQAGHWIGQPVFWFRSVGPVHYRKYNGSHKSMSFVDNRVDELAQKLNKHYRDFTFEDLENAGFNAFHCHFAVMMESTFVWDELELTESQRKQLESDFSKRNLKGLFFVNGLQNQRLLEILNSDSELPEYVLEHFNPRQQEWLSHFEFQMLTGGFESSFGLLHPEVKKRIELSNSQANKIKTLSDQFEKQRDEMEQTLSARRQEMQHEFAKDIARILTDEQKELYTEYTGKVFETNQK